MTKYLLSLILLFASINVFAIDNCIYGKIIEDNKNTSKTYYNYDPNHSHDNSFRSGMCNQSSISKYWNDFGMEKKYWDDGMGYYDVCNVRKPLGRMMTATRLLEISKNSSYSSNVMLNYAYGYSKSAIKKLRVKCGDGNYTNAVHKGAGFWDWLNGYNGNGTVYFYWPGIYRKTVISRAGTLLHEARHRSKGHNGGKKCPCKCSCDSHWGHNGSNTYGALYYWWYGLYARNSNSILKSLALDDAQWNIDNRFVTNPGYRVR